MTATQIDPRSLVEALGLDDTMALARVFRTWVNEELEYLGRDIVSDDFPEYDRVDNFDTRMAQVRHWLVAAVAAEQAWNEDNPIEDDEPTA